MKTAIVCDWLVSYAGAERVLKEIISCFPDADLFAVADFMPDINRAFLNNKTVTTTFIQKLPQAKKRYRSYLPLMPLAIEQLDLSGYDLILSSSHAVAKGVLTGPDQLHISYTHSPMRYAWDLQHQYLRDTGLNKSLRGWVVKYLLHRLRLWDQRAASGVDHFIANSHYIARRILKTYRRPAHVIYPPVDVSAFTASPKPRGNFYLTASRLVPYKKIALIVESFAALPDKRLVVIGDGPELKHIKKKAAVNIEILGHQTHTALLYYMQHAKAFIFAAEEDFGIAPLEAQACGTPVIAYAKGGALETVRGIDKEKPTGIFFHEQSIPAIHQALKDFEQHQEQLEPAACIQNAQQFRPEKFRIDFNAFVKEAIEKACVSV